MRLNLKFIYILLISVVMGAFYAESAQLGQVQYVTSTSDPGVSDDLSRGFRVPTIWVNTSNNDIFVNTDHTEGSASWEAIGSSAGTDSQTLSFTSPDLTISNGNSVDISAIDTTYTAGTGLTLDSEEFSLSHLGIESLSDPDEDSLILWDDAAGAVTWQTAYSAGTNLTLDGTVFKADSFGFLDFDAGSSITISSGSITVTQSVHSVSGDGGVADDLHTISGTNDARVIYLYPEHSGITVLSETGNIVTPSGNSYNIPEDSVLCLIWDSSDSLWKFSGTSSSSPDVAVDLGDTGSDDISALSRINVSGDTNSIVTNNTGSEILFDFSSNIPSADSADGLSSGALDVLSDIDSSLLSGSDGTLTTGTSGTSGNLAEWNTDGDIVDSSVASSALVTEGSTNTFTNKTLTYLDLASHSELTVSSGSVTLTRTSHSIDGEGDADDNLHTIDNVSDSRVAVLWPENSARDITILHSTGNIVTPDGADYTIPDNGWVLLVYDGTNWRVLGGTGTGSSGTTTREFSFTCPEDAESDTLDIDIEIDDDPGFGSTIIDTDTTTSETGWEVFDGTSFTALSAISDTGVSAGYQGNRVSYEFSTTELNAGEKYYIRFRLSDDNGSTWGDWTGDTDR